MTLEMELGMSSSEANSTGWRGTDQGAQLKSSSSDTPSWNGTNASGFSALPGGLRNYTDGSFFIEGSEGLGSFLWCASLVDCSNVWHRFLFSDDDSVGRFFSHPRKGHSVRCVMD